MLDIYLLSLLFVIGSVAAYQDIRYRKVRNRLILAGFAAGCLGFFFNSALLAFPFDIAVSGRFFFNLSVSWLLSYIIWHSGLWSAADAKIFMLFTFLFPLGWYGGRLYIDLFPAANLLVNTFILVLIFFALEVVLRAVRSFYIRMSGCRKEPDRRIRSSFSARLKGLVELIKQNKTVCAKILLVYFCFFLLNDAAQEYFRSTFSFGTLSYIAMIFVFRPLRNVLTKIKTGWLCILAATALVLRPVLMHVGLKDSGIHLVFILKSYGIFMAAIFLFFAVVGKYFRTAEEATINAGDLDSGMVLSGETAGLISRCLKGQRTREKFYADGLTLEQVYRIREAVGKKNIGDIRVCRTFPLVPFFLAGTIVTLIMAAAEKSALGSEVFLRGFFR